MFVDIPQVRAVYDVKNKGSRYMKENFDQTFTTPYSNSFNKILQQNKFL